VRSLDVLGRRHLDRGGPWTVHSVFAHALTLQHADGTLLGIVDAAGGNAPATLMLSEHRISQPLSDLATTGAPAVQREDLLHVERHLYLRLTDMDLWQPEPIVRRLPASDIMQRLRLTAEVAAQIAPAGGLAPLLPEALALADGSVEVLEGLPTHDLVVQRGRQSLLALAAAIRERHWAGTHAPARALSGLGPGLTPAGDDLLAGLALGLRAAKGTVPTTFEAALTAAVVGRTTDLAAARVRYAAAGHPDEHIHRLLTALLMDKSENSLPDAVRAVLAYGHTSGADALVGLLAGVRLGLR
jgi:hypothetical protein